MEMLPGWCHVNSAQDPDLGWSRQELLLATACNRQPEVQTSASAGADTQPLPAVQRKEQAQIDWSIVRLEAGDAWIDCSSDYASGDGRPVRADAADR